jgi:hypothetical protein
MYGYGPRKNDGHRRCHNACCSRPRRCGPLPCTGRGHGDVTGFRAQPNPEVSLHDPFPSDIEILEKAWGEPIPGQLGRIGGVDEWGWAQIYCDNADPPGVFRGEYRNWRLRHKGQFRYVHRNGKPLPQGLFSRDAMLHVADTSLVFHVIAHPPPIDHVELVPIDPSCVELSPLAP